MKPALALAIVLAVLLAGCSREQRSASPLNATGWGAAIVESSGGKQIVPAGTLLPQAVVVQVNDGQGNGIAGAAVAFSGPRGVAFDPASGLTDSSGQVASNVTLGNGAGRYEIAAATSDKSHKPLSVKIQEIALDYQQILGQKLDQNYCERCHNAESTPERVSNYDNLAVKPHAFTDGEFLNKMSDQDLTALIVHGGPALNRSPQMPPYGYTLSKAEIQALLAYIRAVSDPPYWAARMEYSK